MNNEDVANLFPKDELNWDDCAKAVYEAKKYSLDEIFGEEFGDGFDDIAIIHGLYKVSYITNYIPQDDDYNYSQLILYFKDMIVYIKCASGRYCWIGCCGYLELELFDYNFRVEK